MSTTIKAMRHKREKFYQALMLLFGVVLWCILLRILLSPAGMKILSVMFFYIVGFFSIISWDRCFTARTLTAT